MGLDKRLEKRLVGLEHENKVLKQEVHSLKGSQGGREGNSVRRGINSMLRLSTLGRVQHPELYLPSSKLSPVGPRFRKRRLL